MSQEASDSQGTFARVFAEEARGLTIDSWCELLRWVRSTGFGNRPSRADVIAEATRYTDEGILPSWPDFGESA